METYQEKDPGGTEIMGAVLRLFIAPHAFSPPQEWIQHCRQLLVFRTWSFLFQDHREVVLGGEDSNDFSSF
jgi:hypothetical protein